MNLERSTCETASKVDQFTEDNAVGPGFFELDELKSFLSWY